MNMHPKKELHKHNIKKTRHETSITAKYTKNSIWQKINMSFCSITGSFHLMEEEDNTNSDKNNTTASIHDAIIDGTARAIN